MSFKTTDLKMTFLGVIPALKDETGYLRPQDIIALSALMTFKGKSVKELYKQTIDKGQNIDEKVKKIIRKSSLRGHASIATTPAICFTYEASKFLDSMMTGMIFSSSLMASGRRTDTTIDDIVYPTSIDQNKKAKALYKETSENNINFFNKLLASGIEKDDASKVLQYGIYGTGIIAYPLESIVALKKEYESEIDWMPEETKWVLSEIEKYLKKVGVDLIYWSRNLAARNTLPFPNIFKNPEKSNITRELINNQKLSDDLTRIVDWHFTVTKGLEDKAKEISKLAWEIIKSKNSIKRRWRELLKIRHGFLRDYNTAINIKVLSSVSWRVWSEKKRHRTVPMTPESLYYAIDRCLSVFEKYSKKIDRQKINKGDIQKIDRVFTIPSVLKKEKKLLYGYLHRIKESLATYKFLIKKYKIPARDVLFLMPRGVRIDLLQNYDLFNIISGYYTLRTCSTAEVQLRQISLIEMGKIKQLLQRKGLPNLAKLVVTKCHIPGFCLEEKNCPVINGLVKDYDEKFHESMKGQLDKEFEGLI